MATSIPACLLLLSCLASRAVCQAEVGESSGASPVCDDNSCLHGNCSDVSGNAVCACETGWGGNSCDQACKQRSVLEMTKAAEALRKCRYQTVARGAVWVDPEVTNPDPENCYKETNFAFMVYMLEEKTRMCQEELPSGCRSGRSVSDMRSAADALSRCLARLEARGVRPPNFDVTNPDPACLQLGTFDHHVALLEVKAAICNDVRSQCPAPPSDSEKEAVSTRLSACQSNLQTRDVQFTLPTFSSPDPECIAPGNEDFDFYEKKFKLAACLNISYCPQRAVTPRHVQAADRALRNCLSQLEQRSLEFSPQPFLNPDPDCVTGLAAELMKTHDLALQCYDQLPEGECPPPVSISKFQDFAKQLRECRARVVALTGSEPIFPEYTPFPDCQMSAFNRHARLMEFRLKYCLGQAPGEEEACPQPVSIQQFRDFAKELRDCRARVVALTGKEPVFPEFQPNPDCQLTGFNLHARLMEFRAKFCNGLHKQAPREEEACPQPVSIQQFRDFAKELRDCRARVVALTGKEPVFPEFQPNPDCQLTGLNLHARLMEFRAKFCNGLLQQGGEEEACPQPVSIQQFQDFAKELRDCRARVVALTGKEPVFPEFQPNPDCQLTGFNLHARLMEFRAKFCNGLLKQAQCPARVSVTEFRQFAKDLRDCRAIYFARTGSEPVFPEFHPDPECNLSGFNLHARLMEFRSKFCNAALPSLPCPPNPSVAMFNTAAAELRSCREQHVHAEGEEPSWPVFPADPDCFISAWHQHYRELILRTWYCQERLGS